MHKRPGLDRVKTWLSNVLLLQYNVNKLIVIAEWLMPMVVKIL